MKSTTRTDGFSIVEAIIIVVFVGIVAVLGLTFYNVATKKTVTATTSPTAASIKAQPIPDVKSTTDLTTASTDLDSLDLTDSQDAALLDQQDAAF